MARILLRDSMSRERAASIPVASQTLRLAPGLRLLNQEDADRCVLALDDTRQVLLNAVAARLLSFCDGTRTAVQIADDHAGQRAEVMAFLEGAVKSGWIYVADGRARN